MQIGIEYNIVELNDNIELTTIKELYDWLIENVGNEKDNRWFLRYPNIYFANKNDHILFCLKWS